LPDRAQLQQASLCLNRYWSRLRSDPSRQILVACGLGRGRSIAVLYYWLQHGVLALSAEQAQALLRRARPNLVLRQEDQRLLDVGGGVAMAPAKRLLAAALRTISGVQIQGKSNLADLRGVSVFFANHTSHADAAIVWASLPVSVRVLIRPVAAADYWHKTAIRRWLSQSVFRALLVERQEWHLGSDALTPMRNALLSGQHLLLFPEGTRQQSGGALGKFKPGLYYLARSVPSVRFIPIWLENIHHVLPKGAVLPVPFQCAIRFGKPLSYQAQESREEFLDRAREALRTTGATA
jgi:1-acyl-sn-glycerol-3-phosphate acyltransferase